MNFRFLPKKEKIAECWKNTKELLLNIKNKAKNFKPKKIKKYLFKKYKKTDFRYVEAGGYRYSEFFVLLLCDRRTDK